MSGKMTDYIKRDDAIKTLEGWKISGEMILATVPTADVVEVVRCKDCIHNHIKSWNHGKRDNPRCRFTDIVRSNLFYCGFGERAEE